MYVRVSVDKNCDGYNDWSDTTSTYTDSYNPTLSSGNMIYYDIDDDATSVCYDIEIYDDDTSTDQLLDYVLGTGSYYTFTQNSLTSSFSTTHSYDNTGSTESLRAGFEMDVYVY